MTQLKSFDSNGVQFAWDATSLGNYMKCPRYYSYVNLEGWQPANKSVHLLFGGWYATALEHYYKHVAEGDEPLTALRKVVREALVATWDVEGEEGPWVSGHDSKTRDALIRTIVWYVDHYELNPFENHFPVMELANGKPAVELSFSIELSDTILWCGHIDRVASTPDGAYIMDQKTTGAALSAYYFKNYELDVQMSGYTLAGKVMYNLPVKGVIIDAAEIKVGFTRYGRGMVQRSAQQLEEFQNIATQYIANAQQNTADKNFLPNYASCGNYGGCPFRDVCKVRPSLRENFLRADFTRKPRWDPLERR